jgi:repressor LexA
MDDVDKQWISGANTEKAAGKGTADPSHPPAIGPVVRQARLARGLTLDALAAQVGCAKSYLSAIENGRREGVGEDLLAKLESALGLEPGLLVDAARWRATPRQVRDEVAQLRALLREVGGMGETAKQGKEGQATKGLDEAFRSGALHRWIAKVAPDVAAPPPATPAPRPSVMTIPLGDVPVINRVAAGYPRDFTDLGYPARVADDYVRCPDLSDPDAFGARVIGDSMAPTYLEGDIVVFSPARTVKDGMDCFARLEPDHETTFKRVYFETGPTGEELIRLQPLNSAYPPRTLPREQVAGLYAAVSVMRRV